MTSTCDGRGGVCVWMRMRLYVHGECAWTCAFSLTSTDWLMS